MGRALNIWQQHWWSSGADASSSCDHCLFTVCADRATGSVSSLIQHVRSASSHLFTPEAVLELDLHPITVWNVQSWFNFSCRKWKAPHWEFNIRCLMLKAWLLILMADSSMQTSQGAAGFHSCALPEPTDPPGKTYVPSFVSSWHISLNPWAQLITLLLTSILSAETEKLKCPLQRRSGPQTGAHTLKGPNTWALLEILGCMQALSSSGRSPSPSGSAPPPSVSPNTSGFSSDLLVRMRRSFSSPGSSEEEQVETSMTSVHQTLQGPLGLWGVSKYSDIWDLLPKIHLQIFATSKIADSQFL